MKERSDLSIVVAETEEDIQEIAQLAENIWHEHYEAIIGKEQVDYMVEKFQSEAAMKEQIEENGYQYCKLVTLGGLAGYFAFCKDGDSLFLSKLYIDRKYRGRKYAKQAMDYLVRICQEKHINKIYLTVNRENNTSIMIYENLGFTKAGTQVSDIGAGFVMDDYIMEKRF